MSEQATSYVLDEFIAVTPGEPFRLLPVGRLVKNGRAREVTPELLRRFRLPHFRPPVKLGGHADTAPAGGHIVGLEVREDGLYALPEWNDEGATAMARGAFRYHSPEILWEGAMEDPATGEPIEGPLIVGDALLHMPHLGEAAALYEISLIEGAENMTEQTVQMPASAFDRLLAFLRGPAGEPEPGGETPQPQPPARPEQPGVAQYAAVVQERDALTARVTEFEQMTAAMRQERDEMAARLAVIEVQAAVTQRVERYAADLAETPLAEDGELHQLLAGLEEAQAGEIVRRFKALGEQARVSNLSADLGANDDGEGMTPVQALDAAVRERMKRLGIANYTVALRELAQERPELIKAYGG